LVQGEALQKGFNLQAFKRSSLAV